jgi:hypothetical protein
MNLSTIMQRSTSTGAVFDFASVAPGMISERDLVHHLSRVQCWNGNTDFASYSIAQHALVVMSACTLPAARLYALLNSAPATYLGWSDPAFKLWLADQGAELMTLEHKIFVACLERFGIPRPSSAVFADVHDAEYRAEATEWRDVVKGKAGAWTPRGKPLANVIRFKPQPKVEEEFAAALDRELRPFRSRAA